MLKMCIKQGTQLYLLLTQSHYKQLSDKKKPNKSKNETDYLALWKLDAMVL